MPDVTMTDEDREELQRRVNLIDRLEDELKAARTARDALMYELFNSYRADIPDLRHVTGMKRPTVASKVRGPRTRPYRARQDREAAS